MCDLSRKAECVPTFACESKRRPFVREVEKRDKRRSEIELLLIVGVHREPGNVYIKAWWNQGLQMLTTYSIVRSLDHAAQRGRDACGTAYRCSAGSLRFREHTRPRPQSGKVRRSDTQPGEVHERAEHSEGNDTTPIRNTPVSPCKRLCAIP